MKYLAELLEKETNVYSNYLDLAVKKKQALIDNNIDALDNITEEEKSLSGKVLALEAARIEYLREQGYAGNITLNELLTKIPSREDREQIQNSASTLKEVLAQCKKFTDGNMSLMKQSSNYINHMIKIFTSNLNGGAPATYKKGAYQFQPGTIADVQG